MLFLITIFACACYSAYADTTDQNSDTTSSGLFGIGAVKQLVSQGTDSGKQLIAQTKQTTEQIQNKPPANTTPSNEDIQALSYYLQQNPELVQKVASEMNGQHIDNANQPTIAQGVPATSSSASNQAQSFQQNITPAPQQQSTIAPAVQPVTPEQIPSNPWQFSNQLEAINNAIAYRSVTQQAFPLSPEQIHQLRNLLDETLRAAAADPYQSPPRPTSSSLMINLSPGSTPPVIRLAKGFVSTLLFIDSTGAPWPVESYDIGDPATFNIAWNQKNNTLMIQAQKDYNYGNLAVKLVNLNTPIMLTLVPGQRVVDYRVDLTVQGIGPNAQPSIQGSGLPDHADPKLLNILDGISPKGSNKLNVKDELVEAWRYGGEMFLRTRYTILSPAWIAKMSSADGMNAYEMQQSPMVLVMRHGKVVPVKIEGL